MKKILFLGGDKRMQIAAQKLKKEHFVATFGLFNGDEAAFPSQNFDAVVLPIPTTRDNRTVNCPLSKIEIPLSVIPEYFSKSLILSGGYEFKGLKFIDYLKDDAFCILNAVSTAEGAIAKAIELTDTTLFESKILVIGYGRCGKILTDRLLGLKCDVTVSARKQSDFALLRTLGIKHIHTDVANINAPLFDIIFNTIDIPVLTAQKMLKSTLILDISTKGGIDFKAAKELELKALKLPSIPAKTAAKSAGEILSYSIEKYLEAPSIGEL